MKKVKLIALIAALAVAIGVYQFLRELGKPQETPRTAVVVAAVDIPENTLITADMVMLQPVATEALLPGHLRALDSAVGMVMSSDVYAGEQILTNRLVQVGTEVDQSKTLAYKMDEGMRAITISVGSTSGLSNMIKPGNRVDLILHYSYEDEKKSDEEENGAEAAEAGAQTEEQPEAETVMASRILLQNVTVLAVDAELGKNGAVEYSTITLQLSPEDALKLAHAEWTGSIRPILRSPLDGEESEELKDIEITMDELRGIGEEETP